MKALNNHEWALFLRDMFYIPNITMLDMVMFGIYFHGLL